MFINIVEIYFGIANGQIIFDRVICKQYDNGGVLLFMFSFMEEIRKIVQSVVC